MNTGKDNTQGKQGVQGEGNYEATRRFDKAERDFVESGKVDDAARKAQPENAEQAREMEQAEQTGKSHSKGEAPGDEARMKKPAQP